MGWSARTFWSVVGLLALCAGAKAVLYDTIDPDCFWHLRVADELLRRGVGPLVDELSFASMREPWTPYSWLAELGMKSLWDACGWRGAILASATMNAGFVVLLATLCRRGLRSDDEPHRPGYTACLLLTAVLTFVAIPYLSFRPATLAIVLLGVVALLMRRDAQGASFKNVFVVNASIVVITALLANVHLFAFLVPLWMALRWAGDRIDACPSGTSLWTVAACGAAACATPMLPGVLRTLVHYQFHDPMVASGFIVEMQPFWKGTLGTVAAALIAFVIGRAATGWRRWTTTDRLMLCMAIAMLLAKGRYAPLFAITAAPVLAAGWRRTADRALAKPGLALAAVALIAAGAMRVALAWPSDQTTMEAWMNRHGPDVRGCPAGAVSYVLAHVRPVHGRILNDFTGGGYLAWRLNGRGFKVLVDGRTQVYPDAFWNGIYLGDETARQTLLQGLTADAAIVPVDERAIGPSLKRMGWRTAWRDERSEVLVPDGFASADPQ